MNPTQFDNAKDLQNYPNTLNLDLQQLRKAGVMAVFGPAAAEIYAMDSETITETTQLANRLLRAVRPWHFCGVTTVVCKLFNIVQPDLAVFGEKDHQQLHVIRRMVRDLHIPVEIIGAPTFRESDGLAMSSRNRRLNPADRAAARALRCAPHHFAAQARCDQDNQRRAPRYAAVCRSVRNRDIG